jgi:hypothetical protein
VFLLSSSLCSSPTHHCKVCTILPLPLRFSGVLRWRLGPHSLAFGRCQLQGHNMAKAGRKRMLQYKPQLVTSSSQKDTLRPETYNFPKFCQ